MCAVALRGPKTQTAAESEACQADFEKYRPGVQPGGGRVLECLGKHLDQFTPQCKSVVEALLRENG